MSRPDDYLLGVPFLCPWCRCMGGAAIDPADAPEGVPVLRDSLAVTCTECRARWRIDLVLSDQRAA